MSEDEIRLTRKAKNGDVSSFEALVRPYQKCIYGMVLSITGNVDDADDAFQETIVHAYRSIASFRGDASFSTWLYRIALNVSRNWVRSQARASSERFANKFSGADNESIVDPESILICKEQQYVVHQALLSLPDHYREPLILRHYENLSYEDIALVLCIPVGTVRSRLAQGRKLLSDMLNANEPSIHEKRR